MEFNYRTFMDHFRIISFAPLSSLNTGFNSLQVINLREKLYYSGYLIPMNGYPMKYFKYIIRYNLKQRSILVNERKSHVGEEVEGHSITYKSLEKTETIRSLAPKNNKSHSEIGPG